MENMVANNIFWKNKKIFITGHTGFKGSWLCMILHHLGAKLAGYSLKPKKDNLLFNSANIYSLMSQNFFGDIRNNKNLLHSVKSFKPEIFIHMAAQPIVLDSYKNPKYTFDVNINGTLNVLEIVRRLKYIKACVIVTTDKVYRNDNLNKVFKEDDSLGGSDPYSGSKACKEIIVDSYIKSFFKKNKNCRIATVRAGNVIGGGDRARHRIFPDFFKSIKSKKILNVRFPNAIRPWQFVLEPLFGYLILSKKLYQNRLKNIPNTWNFGPDKSSFKNVRSIITLLKKNFKCKIIYSSKKIKNETYSLKLSNIKSKKYLGWRPVYNLNYSLKEIVSWEKNFMRSNNENLLKFSTNQIIKYIKLSKINI
jgi:CDP-glucose 4,6-dehydratase